MEWEGSAVDPLLHQAVYSYFSTLPFTIGRGGQYLIHDSLTVFVQEVGVMIVTAKEPAARERKIQIIFIFC